MQSQNDYLWAQPGTPCWVETPTTEKFLKAHILSIDPHLIVQIDSTQTIIDSELTLIQQLNLQTAPNPILGFEDMVNMDILNEAELLNNLKLRYDRDLIFTYIGPTLLVINPYKPLVSDFTPENYLKFKDQAISPIFVLKDNPPHVFAIGAKAFHQLTHHYRDQAIVISGESGAGKTENTKFAMRFITSMSSEISTTEESKSSIIEGIIYYINPFIKLKILITILKDTSIEEKILGCNPILEAFGNAKTVRNDNSSRFGKYVKIQVSRQYKKIKGAEITNYLLEKSRVTSQSKGERNYHIFYHLLGSENQSILKEFKLLDENGLARQPSSFDYLKESNCFEVESLCDKEQYKEVCNSLNKLKFSKEELHGIWAILAAILHLGNMSFCDKAFQKDENNRCEVDSLLEFKYIVELLGVDGPSMLQSLVCKPRTTKEGLIYSILKKTQCIELRDSLSKGLYEKLFNWLVKRMNLASNEQKDVLTIGLLDIFGFEKFENNSLEQLCINFTNEKLHQLYIEYVFISEKDELASQGLKSQANSLILPQDNIKLIELFEGSRDLKGQFISSLFFSLKDSKIPTVTDEALLKNILALKNPHLSLPKNKYDKKFNVLHTADLVEYNITGFKVKNNDSFPEELEKVILGSSITTIASIFKGVFEPTIKDQLLNPNLLATPRREHTRSIASLNSPSFPSSPSKLGNNKAIDTLLQQFALQMKTLMEELRKCDSNFIRCIKPNELKQKENFQSDYLLKQIKYLGVLESVKIRKDSFPFRKDLNLFWKEYSFLCNKVPFIKDNILYEELKELCYWTLFRRLVIDPDDIRRKVLFGSSKLYMKQDLANSLEKLKLHPDPLKIKSRMIIKQFRIWSLQDNRKAPLEVLGRVCKGLRGFWNRLRGYVKRIKFLRKKMAVKVLIPLFRMKLQRDLRRFRLFGRWKGVEKACEGLEERYRCRNGLLKLLTQAKAKTWFLKEKALNIIGDSFYIREKEVLKEIFGFLTESVLKRRVISRGIDKSFDTIKKRLYNSGFELIKERYEDIINKEIAFQIKKEKYLQSQREKKLQKEKSFELDNLENEKSFEEKPISVLNKEISSSSNQRNSKKFSGMGSMARELFERKALEKINLFYEKSLINQAFHKFYLFSKEKQGADLESPKKLKETHDLPEKVFTKFFGELKLSIYSKMPLFSKEHFLKAIKPLLSPLSETSLLLQGFFQVNEINSISSFMSQKVLSLQSQYELLKPPEISLERRKGSILLHTLFKGEANPLEGFKTHLKDSENPLKDLLETTFPLKEPSKEEIPSKDVSLLIEPNHRGSILITKPQNQNMVIWKEIASQCVNKRSSFLSLFTPIETTKKVFDKELKKYFKAFFIEKNEEKVLLISIEILALANFSKTQAIYEEVYLLCLSQIEKAPEKYFKLLSLITSSFPTERYKESLIIFLTNLNQKVCSKDPLEDQRIKFQASFILYNLNKAINPRLTVLSQEQAQAFSKGNTFPVPIHLLNEMPIWVPSCPFTTIQEALIYILNTLGLPKGFHAFLGLFTKEGFYEDSLLLLDCSKRLNLKIRVFVPLNQPNLNEGYLNLLYIQAFSDYMKGIYSCNEKEAVELGGLALLIDKGKNPIDDIVTINKIVPTKAYESPIKEIYEKVIYKYSIIRNELKENETVKAFLKLLSRKDLFNSQTFIGDCFRLSVDKGGMVFEEVIWVRIEVIIKPWEIVFVRERPNGREKERVFFKEIEDFGVIKEKKVFFIRVWKEREQWEEVFLIESERFEEIFGLLKGYASVFGKEERKKVFFVI